MMDEKNETSKEYESKQNNNLLLYQTNDKIL